MNNGLPLQMLVLFVQAISEDNNAENFSDSLHMMYVPSVTQGCCWKKRVAVVRRNV